MAEHDEQVAVIEYCDLKSIPAIHIPNEGKRSPATAARLKAEGMRPGFPDLLIPVARGGYYSLYIEMKDKDARQCDITADQVDWIYRLRREGMAAWACFGAANAIACIDWYMAL